MSGARIPVGFDDLDMDIYFEISPIGAVRSAQIVYSSDPKSDKEILNWFLGHEFSGDDLRRAAHRVSDALSLRRSAVSDRFR